MIFPKQGLCNAISMLCAPLVLWFTVDASPAAEWRASMVSTPGSVTAIEIEGVQVRVAIGHSWYRLAGDTPQLKPAPPPYRPAVPAGALPDARVAVGHQTVTRAWLAEPTRRYDHGILGDAIEAGSLIIELRSDQRRVLRLSSDAVFEDIEPRIVKLNGAERIILVKSYLDRGSALAVIDPETATVIAETPAIGHPHAWLNPAGVADFFGNGVTEIALVRQPHVIGRLELWSWRQGKLQKTAEVADVANHFIGSRALGMSFVADFDRDGRSDLAVPSLDRKTLRLIAFTPQAHDIARVKLPARAATNIGAIKIQNRLALVVGLENGQLILIHEEQ